MYQITRAIYREGTFVLPEPLDIPEESAVALFVQRPLVLAPGVTDQAERARVLDTLVRRMQQNAIPTGAPRLTRESLHARR